MSSLLPADAPLLVLENGVYGERMSRVARVYDMQHEALTHPWGAALDLDAVQQQLATGRFKYLAMVHHETTTGRLNELDEVLALCEPRMVCACCWTPFRVLAPRRSISPIRRCWPARHRQQVPARHSRPGLRVVPGRRAEPARRNAACICTCRIGMQSSNRPPHLIPRR